MNSVVNLYVYKLTQIELYHVWEITNAFWQRSQCIIVYEREELTDRINAEVRRRLKQPEDRNEIPICLHQTHVDIDLLGFVDLQCFEVDHWTGNYRLNAKLTGKTEQWKAEFPNDQGYQAKKIYI